ncbi:hypothetical protein DX244_25450 [Salmonella enterica]|nr:hypothetical protein [Salmonella enterica]
MLKVTRKQLFLGGILLTPASFAASPQLTPAQQQHLKQVMDARINNTDDRETILHEWSEVHRVAEFLCRPAALEALQKQDKQADKVFLGDGKNGGLTLQTATRLTGTGQYRAGGTVWKMFSFSCELSPATGEVTDFRYDTVRPMAPGPVIMPDTKNNLPRLK